MVSAVPARQVWAVPSRARLTWPRRAAQRVWAWAGLTWPRRAVQSVQVGCARADVRAVGAGPTPRPTALWCGAGGAASRFPPAIGVRAAG